MFILLRRIERWLHQHIFKVGWLSTHDYQTTTILYYTFFMPGVILHELVYYLAAGIFNVRAERHIKWPDKQEVGELQLNFVKIAPRTHPIRKALVTSMPLLVGLISIWAISYYIFDITTVVETMSTGELSDVGAAFNMLLAAPLFWLWIYIIFTIANTMFPTVPKDLKGWRSVFIGLGVVALALFLVGVGGEIFEVLQSPLSQIISVLQATFVLIMIVDVIMVMILGLIEYTIERITGHSATFRGNRMYTMTREEAIAEREKEREKELKRLAREEKRKAKVDNSPISIYEMAFSIPGAPGDIPVTQLETIEEMPVEFEEVVEEKPTVSMPSFGGLSGTREETKKPLTEEQKQQRDAIAARVNFPERRAPIEEKPKTEEVAPKKETSSPVAGFGVQTPTPETKSDDEDKKPVTTSRFGIKPPTKSAPSIPEKVETKDDEDKSEETIKPPSRFGVRPPTKAPVSAEVDTKSDDIDTEKDKQTPAPSRFGIRPPSLVAEDDEKLESEAPEDGESIRVVGRPASPSLLDEEADDDDDDDGSLLRRGRGKDAVASLFGQLDDIDDDIDEDELDIDLPLAPRGTSEFGNRFGKLSDSNTKDSPSRFGSRFGQESPSSNEEDKASSSLTRFGSSSRFGNSSLSSKSEDDEDKEERSSLGNFARPEKPVSTRFGSSRPAPKPTSSIGDEDEDEELIDDIDDIVYEDIEDEYYDYDDDEYFDYDDDD